MKPFNLEEARHGKKVVTRGGKCFVYGGYNKNATERERVLGWIDGKAISFGEDGKEVRSIETANDLFMATEKKTVWMNAYRSDGELGFHLGCVFRSRDEALNQTASKGRDYLGTYSIEVEV